MAELIVLDLQSNACCATCNNWGLAVYYPHPKDIGDHEPYCTMLGISLEPYLGEMATRTTCSMWKRECFETDAVRLYERLSELALSN